MDSLRPETPRMLTTQCRNIAYGSRCCACSWVRGSPSLCTDDFICLHSSDDQHREWEYNHVRAHVAKRIVAL
jgi:hypothetical protein